MASSNSLSIKSTNLIDHFYIFHPISGRKEGEEHKKLMFYYPKDISIDVRIQTIGFCEAVVKFTESFADPMTVNPRCPFHEVSTLKQLHVYCKLESDYIMGLVINRLTAQQQGYTVYSEALYHIMLTSYRMYRLFFGTFHKTSSQENGMEQLRNRLDYFFNRYLGTLKFHTLPLMDLYAGIQFMSLDATNYLRIETMVANLCETLPKIRHTVFLYQDQLLWYDIPKVDLYVLYRYLTQNLLPMSLRAELQPETQKRYPSSHHHGKFITGPMNLEDAEDTGKLPVVFLQSLTQNQRSTGTAQNEQSGSIDNRGVQELDSGEIDLTEYNLIVYRALNATLVLLVSTKEEMELEFFRICDTILGPEMTSLGSTLRDIYGRHNITTDFHYIYYNPITSSLMSNYFNQNQESKLTVMPSEVIRVVCDLRDEIVKDEYMGDVIAKMDGDWWICAKKINERELMMMIPNKGMSLVDIHEEVKLICNNHFQNIFLNQ